MATGSRNVYHTPAPGSSPEAPSSPLPRKGPGTLAGEGSVFCAGSWARGEGHFPSGISKILAEEPAGQRDMGGKAFPRAAVPSTLPGGGWLG